MHHHSGDPATQLRQSFPVTLHFPYTSLLSWFLTFGFVPIIGALTSQ